MGSSRLRAAFAVMGAVVVLALASGDASVAGCSDNANQRDTQPVWSPAGDQIRFLRTLQGCFSPRVFMRVAPTGGTVQPTRYGEIGVFSPDGTNVAFGSTDGIRVTDPQDGMVRRLTSGFDHDPAWSPDGSQLAFVREAPRDVFLVAVDGSRTVDLTHDAATEEEPRFSPDGNWISVSIRRGGTRVGVELIRTDGAARVMAPLAAYDAAWSPDSRALAVLGGPARYSDLYVVSLDGAVTQITRTPGDETQPAWAPDGSLAVASADAAGPLLLRFTTAGAPLTWNGEIRPYRDYGWSPDGHTLAWVGPAGALVVAAADGSGARTPVGFTVDTQLSWAPDSKHIAVSAQRPPCRTRAEIAVVDAASLALVPLTNSCEITGTDGPDVLSGTTDDDAIRGLGGDDRISAREGVDLVEGGPGNDRIDGGTYPDDVDGGPGDDVVIGGGGLDTLTGGPGRDLLVGGWAKDLVRAQDGEPDTVRCGDQVDVVYADVVDQVAGDCDVVLRTPADDYIRGTYGADTIDAGPGNDYVLANAGNDYVDGGTGDDFVVGDWGDDRLVGGTGRDRLLGGPGADVLDARDGRRDLVDCGGREDRALVDRYDVVASNCERVRRSA